MRFQPAAAVLVASLALAACSGGGGSSPGTPSSIPVTTPATAAAAAPQASMTINVKVPAATHASSTRRHPQFIDPSTAQIQVSAVPVGQTLIGGPLTKAPCTSTSCTVTFQVPVGLDHFFIQLVDSAGYGDSYGDFLFQIQPGVANTGQFTFYGDVASVSLTLVNPATSLTLMPGVSQTIPLYVNQFDHDGTQIVGPLPLDGYTVRATGDPVNVTLSQALVDGALTPSNAGDTLPTIDLQYDGGVPPAGMSSTIGFSDINGNPVAGPTFTIGSTYPAVSVVPVTGIQPFQAQPSGEFYAFVPTGVTNVVGVVPSLTQSTDASTVVSRPFFSIQLNPGASAFSVRRAALQRVSARTVAPPAHGLIFRDAEPPMPSMASLRARAVARVSDAARRRPSAFTPPTAVGQQQTFFVANFAISATSGPATYNSVAYTLGAITAHGWIWIDNTFTPATSPLPMANAIGTNFEQAYTEDTTMFGPSAYGNPAQPLPGSFDEPTCDSTGAQDGGEATFPVPDPGRINVLITNPQNFGTGLGGYFTAANYFPQGLANCFGTGVKSNEAPMIYVGWFGSPTELVEFNHEGTAHEFQHLTNFVNHSVLRSGDLEDPFLNEGMSQVAQDLSQGPSALSYQTLYNAGMYLANPDDYSLTSFSGLENGTYGTGCLGCYGNSYLFVRYLADRFGTGVLTKLNQSKLDGLPNVEAATGVTPMQILQDYATTLAVSDTGIVPKTDLVHNYQTLSLHGDNVDGPSGMYDTTLTGPSATSLADPSSTAIAPGYEGAFWFFTVPSGQVGASGFSARVMANGYSSLSPIIASK